MNIRVNGNYDKLIFKQKGSDGHIWKLFYHYGMDRVRVFYWLSQGNVYIVSINEIKEWFSENEYMMDEKEKEALLYYINGGE